MNSENTDPSWIGEETEENLTYRENILDHYRNPRNYGRVPNPTAVYREINPVCGDEVEISFKINNKMVEEIKFTGKGCAISMAAASMLTDALMGKTVETAEKTTKEDVMHLLGVRLGPVRMNCGLLCLRAFLKALSQENLNG